MVLTDPLPRPPHQRRPRQSPRPRLLLPRRSKPHPETANRQSNAHATLARLPLLVMFTLHSSCSGWLDLHSDSLCPFLPIRADQAFKEFVMNSYGLSKRYGTTAREWVSLIVCIEVHLIWEMDWLFCFLFHAGFRLLILNDCFFLWLDANQSVHARSFTYVPMTICDSVACECSFELLLIHICIGSLWYVLHHTPTSGLSPAPPLFHAWPETLVLASFICRIFIAQWLYDTHAIISNQCDLPHPT